jgi:poly-gamma-glutamate synthesis protein (capsule biosynthesis protein)
MRQRLIVSSLIIVLVIVVGATVSGVLVSNQNKADVDNSAASSSSPQQGQQQTFEFHCTNDAMTTESEICYDSSQDCVAVFCCETTTKSSNVVDECLSSSLELFKCAEANASIPTNENCPPLPFYAIPKVWENNGDKEKELTIGAVGDVILESTLQRQAARHGSYAESWKAVTPLLQKPHIMYGNFEGTASFLESIPDDPDSPNYNLTDVDRGSQPLVYGNSTEAVFYSGGPFLQFNYHPMLATNLATSGFDVVSTSNNHCLDRGPLGINSTIDALKKAGVAHAGTRKSPNDPWYALVERHGWTTAWVACTDGTNFERNRRNRQADLVLNCFSSNYTDLVASLAADPDIHVVISVVHWGSRPPPDDDGDFARSVGYEDTGFSSRGVVYQRQPDCSMRHWTRAVAEAGASVIVGAHPHVLHGWEKYITSYGRPVLVVHSLGNFNSHGGYLVTKPPPAFLERGYDSEIGFLLRRTSVLLQFGLQWNAEKNWAQVSCLSYIPLYRRLSDIGFVDPVLTAENQTTYEIHVETPAADSVERAFVAKRFGPLRDYARGGGVDNGQSWEAAEQNDAQGEFETISCFPFSEAPVTTVDGNLYDGLLHQNEDGTTVSVPQGHCLKCEPVEEGTADGCRWCEYRAYSYCTGPSNTKVDLGQEFPWDECLALATDNVNCSDIVYAGGDIGRCTCMRQGEPCNIARSAQSQTVYIRQCGLTPPVVR